jgi:hypothetical protein
MIIWLNSEEKLININAQEQFTRENGKEALDKEKVKLFGMTEHSMTGIGHSVTLMVMVNFNISIKISTRENGKIISEMELES